MLIHSVTPVHYLKEQPEYPALTFKRFSGGFLEGQETPQGFMLSRLHSTDPRIYLKKEYAPGSEILLRKHHVSRLNSPERNEFS